MAPPKLKGLGRGLDALLAELEVRDLRAEADRAAEADDFLADVAHDVAQDVRADVRLVQVEDLRRRPRRNECLEHIAHVRIADARRELAVGERARPAFAELDIRLGVERAARFGDEIGGHLMSGHIIATTAITRIDESAHNRTLWFALPEALKPYILTKGFVGLDGCSLTIGEVGANEFNVHLIPETLERTLFGTRKAGDIINIEIDPQTQAVVDTVTRVLSQQASA